MKSKMLTIASIVAISFSTAGIHAQKVGETAPDFSFSDLEGKTHTLSQYKGKVVFLNIFGNKCPFCEDIGNDTEKKVNQVYSQKGDFQALGLDTWPNSTTSTVGAFKSTTGITYPLLLDAKSIEQSYATSYDRVIVIDREGIIRHKNNTLRVSQDLENAIAVIEGLYSTTSTDAPGASAEGFSAVYPNPSGDLATARFVTARAGDVKIRLYNPLGQEVLRVVNGVYPSGEHETGIPVSDLPAGLYILRMDAGERSWTRKMQVNR
jgi:peroxiredoxin